jgi:hypothetical protein
MSAREPDRTLTELEYVEVAVRRAANLVARRDASALLILAEQLMSADISQLNGGSDTRYAELQRLRRQQQ